MSARRVLYLDHTAALGGAEIALLRLLQHLDRGRWEPVVVLGEEGRLAPQLRSMQIPTGIRDFPRRLADLHQDGIRPRSLASPARLAALAWYVRGLAGLLRELRIDLVHTNSWRASLVGAIAGKAAGVPVVWQVHSVAAVPMMSRTGAALVRLLARLPQAVICNSTVTAGALRLPPSRVAVIPCGLPPSPSLACDEAARSPRVGMVSRFAFIKGQHVFLDAIGRLAATYPTAEFVLAGTALFGEHAYEAEIRARARASAAAARIRLPGFVDDTTALLASLDVVVSPSVAAEGFGQVIAEAMMAGKPVVASSAGAPAEIIEDRRTGRLVAPGDSSALAAAIDELLANPTEARAMGRRARRVALERYDIEKTTRSVERVYEEVLARR